jgi:hypothetical protein
MEHKKGILKLSPGMGADETLEAKLQVSSLVCLGLKSCQRGVASCVCQVYGQGMRQAGQPTTPSGSWWPASKAMLVSL